MAADKNEVAWTFSFPSIDGGTLDLADFKGRVLLVTNTAVSVGIRINTRAWKSSTPQNRQLA
jgi:glutathione peroxidase-family protein